MGRGRSIRRYAPLGVGRRRGRADRLNLTVCHRNQRDPIAGREQRQGKRKDRPRGSEGWILTRRPPNRLLLSPVLQGPLEPSDGFEPPKRGQVVHLPRPYAREPSALVSCGAKAKALLFARDLSACWHSQHSVITHCDHSLLPERLRRHLLLL